MDKFVQLKSGGLKLYFSQGQDGTLKAVTDPEVEKQLKAGTLPYESLAANRPLRFADDTAQQTANTTAVNQGGIERPASTQTGTLDTKELLNQKIREYLKHFGGSSSLQDLQRRKESLIARQLSAPVDVSGVTPSFGTNMIKARGSEFGGALDQVDDEMSRQKEIRSEDLSAISALSELVEKLSGGEIKSQFTEANGRRLLVNMLTGETIKDLGYTDKPTGATPTPAANVTPSGKPDVKSLVAYYTAQDGVPAPLKQQLTKGLNIINKLDAMTNTYNSGLFPGASPAQGFYAAVAPEFTTPKSTTAFQADEAKLRQDLTSYITGAAYTSLQEKDINNIIPRTTLTDDKNRQRINQMYNTILGDIEAALVSSGYNAQIPRVNNLFNGGETKQVKDPSTGKMVTYQKRSDGKWYRL